MLQVNSKITLGRRQKQQNSAKNSHETPRKSRSLAKNTAGNQKIKQNSGKYIQKQQSTKKQTGKI